MQTWFQDGWHSWRFGVPGSTTAQPEEGGAGVRGWIPQSPNPLQPLPPIGRGIAALAEGPQARLERAKPGIEAMDALGTIKYRTAVRPKTIPKSVDRENSTVNIRYGHTRYRHSLVIGTKTRVYQLSPAKTSSLRALAHLVTGTKKTIFCL